MRTAVGIGDAVGQLLDREQAVGFDDAAFAVNPGGLNGVEPGALDRQVVGDDADALALLLDLAVVVADPVAHQVADVPGRIVPDQEEGLHPVRLELAAAPVQVVDRDGADGLPIDEAQPQLVTGRLVGRVSAQQQAIASQRLGVRVVLRDRLFDQPQPLVLLSPGPEAGPSQTTPPDLILEAQGPGRMARGQANQAVARTFFRAYSGSGLVIHCLARFQRTPRRRIAWRIVSPLTCAAVIPSTKLTSAANSIVHTLVGRPKVRGLWSNNARICCRPTSSTLAWIVCGRLDPRVRQASSPSCSNAPSTFRTVWSLQPSSSAIRGTHSPRALASRIWQRRSTYRSFACNPASKRSRSASVNGRTKIGDLIPTLPHDSDLSRRPTLDQPRDSLLSSAMSATSHVTIASYGPITR